MSSQTPIKLLFVIDNIEFGGGERVFAQIINGLKNKPYDLFLASNPGQELYQAIDGRTVTCLPLDFSKRIDPSSLFILIGIIKKHQIDIVHAQGARAEFYARLASHIVGSVKYVSTITAPVQGWHDVSVFRRMIYGFFDRLTERYVDRFIVVSDALRKMMIDAHGIPAEKVILIYNGIETSLYYPEEDIQNRLKFRSQMGFSSEEKIVGAIGRMVWVKGFEYLIRGIPAVLRSHPEARFLFVGDGPLREILQELSASLGVAHQVVFSGFKRNMRDILATIDLCVIPSLREGFPMVTLEAMAMAKPIVATSIDGITEQISDGVDGILVPPGDSAALSRAVTAILRDQTLGRNMGKRARQTVETKFPVEKMVAETEKVYQSLIS